MAGLKLGGEHAELPTEAQHTQHGQPRKDKGSCPAGHWASLPGLRDKEQGRMMVLSPGEESEEPGGSRDVGKPREAELGKAGRR